MSEEKKTLTITEDFGVWSEYELESEVSEGDTYGTTYDQIYMIYSKNTTEPIYTTSRRIAYEARYAGTILTEYEEGYLCTCENEVWLMDLNGLREREIISGKEKISFGYRENNIEYLIAENSEEEQSIYRLQLDTFQMNKLVDLKKDEKVIAKEGNVFICASPRKIILRNVEEAKQVGAKKIDSKIDWEKDTVEIAGEYLFVYDYQEGITVQEQVKWR